MNKVLVDNKGTRRFLHQKTFLQALEITLRLAKVRGETEVNVIVVNNEQIKAISCQYKKIDKATDVLSFRADWQNLYRLVGKNILGDIYISFEKVVAQAKEYGHSRKREWHYLFVHGLLHLLGHDHESERESATMNALADQIMAKLQVSR